MNGPDESLPAIWTTDSVPAKEQCAKAVATEGDTFTARLVAGNRVCGRTTEGRVFRIEVLGMKAGGIRSRTTVWNK